MMCLLALSLAACGTSKATEVPVVAKITYPTAENAQIEPTTTIAPVLTPVNNSTPSVYMDVEYKPASERYPEMDVPLNGTVSCNIAGNNVTFTDLGYGLMEISKNTNERFLVSEEDVRNADTPHKDGWVKIPLMGRISVAYINGQWRTDWIEGCPSAAKTPGPP